MFLFKEYSNELCIFKEDKPVISGISFWIKPDFTEKIYLNFTSLNDNIAIFENDVIGKAKLVLEQENNIFSLKALVKYAPETCDQKYNNHFDIESAFGVDVENIVFDGNYMANYIKSEILAGNNNCQFWTRPFISNDIKELPMRTQGILYQYDDCYTFILSTCDSIFKSWLMSNETGKVTILSYSNDYRNNAEATIAIFAFGEDPYCLPRVATKYGMQKLGKEYPLRDDREYPKYLEYLGWCSWDAFHMDVSEMGLKLKAREFNDKGIPVRWFMIDDMWGDVRLINRATMHSRELYSFKADEKRFPRGLKGVSDDLKKQYNLWVGLWHPITGYWHGFDPVGDIAREYKDLMFYAPNKQLVHKPDYDSAYRFYDAQHKYYKECGIDFVKIDNQGNIRNYSGLISSIGEAATNIHNAIEDSVDKHFNGALINCMGMTIENYWNRPRSAVSRFSGDFKPQDRKWFINHLLQCSYNSLVQGSLYVGDWDMWWSDDEQSTKNAILRAMSGGPVYVSDELGRSIKDTIMPIVLSDGKIIRLKNAALPTKDCLLENCRTNGKLFKVFNKVNDCGVLAVFNIDEEEREVRGDINVANIPDLNAERYCVFDWFSKKAVALDRNDKIQLELGDYNDFRLLHFVPIIDGIAPIGLLDKYMSTATYNVEGDFFIPMDDGLFGFYSEKKLPYKEISENIYVLPVDKEEKFTLPY